jgi:hypothetical protein
MAVRERVIEKYLVQQVNKLGGRAIKLTSSGLRSLPDRLCIFGNGISAFVECKAPGRKPTKQQAILIRWLKDKNHIAVVIDSRPKVDVFISLMKQKGV